jgi:hypothetical protein
MPSSDAIDKIKEKVRRFACEFDIFKFLDCTRTVPEFSSLSCLPVRHGLYVAYWYWSYLLVPGLLVRLSYERLSLLETYVSV